MTYMLKRLIRFIRGHYKFMPGDKVTYIGSQHLERGVVKSTHYDHPHEHSRNILFVVYGAEIEKYPWKWREFNAQSSHINNLKRGWRRNKK